MSQPLEPSTLHQWFKIALGHASNRHYSREPVNCDRSGIFGWMAIIPLLLGLLGMIGLLNGDRRFAPLTVIGLPIGILLIRLSSEFERRERFAQARLRRRECVRCGLKTDGPDRDRCIKCASR